MVTSGYKFTEYFEKEVLRKRPYLKKEWCISVIENPIKVEPQEHNRFRFWGTIKNWMGAYFELSRSATRKPFTIHFPTGGSSYET
jgi:hypothetical protein